MDNQFNDLNNDSKESDLDSEQLRTNSLKKQKKSDEFSLKTHEEKFYKEFIIRLERLRDISVLASLYFEEKSLHLTVPTILLTTIGSIASFLSASSFFTEESRVILNLGIGVIGSIASLMQTLGTAFKFSTKSEMFRSAAEQYDKLIIEIKFELTRHNDKHFIDTLEKKNIRNTK